MPRLLVCLCLIFVACGKRRRAITLGCVILSMTIFLTLGCGKLGSVNEAEKTRSGTDSLGLVSNTGSSALGNWTLKVVTRTNSGPIKDSKVTKIYLDSVEISSNFTDSQKYTDANGIVSFAMSRTKELHVVGVCVEVPGYQTNSLNCSSQTIPTGVGELSFDFNMYPYFDNDWTLKISARTNSGPLQDVKITKMYLDRVETPSDFAGTDATGNVSIAMRTRKLYAVGLCVEKPGYQRNCSSQGIMALTMPAELRFDFKLDPL